MRSPFRSRRRWATALACIDIAFWLGLLGVAIWLLIYVAFHRPA